MSAALTLPATAASAASAFVAESTAASGAAPVVSVVVIGRNEGERLRRCLRSVHAAHWGVGYELIYVDSRSVDDSVAIATQAGARTLVLDDASPCASKGRNLGWRAARGDFILFLDGDTELAPGFVPAALGALRDATLCAAWGHRRESDPDQSVYTRVLDLDWVYPTGRTLYFGGDVLVRRAALEQVGGFDPTLKAGEEPELCARLRARGWQIEHLDVPMTRHDLAVRSLRAYALRCYRGGLAYAEVAHRMRGLGDGLWQRESLRDRLHGMAYLAFPLLLALAFALDTAAGLTLLVLALAVLLRSAWRCRWKAPGQPLLWLQYALHSHLQKIPALAGQLAWQRAHARRAEVGLVEYKDDAPTGPAVPAGDTPEAARRASPKAVLAVLLAPLARLARWHADRGARLWAFARLREALGGRLDASNVVLGPVAVEGTRHVRIGRGALIYPGVVLETQGAGRIEIGDRVVLSRGVHIVAFEHVRIGDDAMVGEYASLRDANHRASDTAMRDSGHDSAPVELGRNVWIGRGAAVLRGVRVGEGAIVGANAVVTRDLPARCRAVGAPARPL